MGRMEKRREKRIAKIRLLTALISLLAAIISFLKTIADKLG